MNKIPSHLYRDLPSDEHCWLVNSALWLQFKEIYKWTYGFYPKDTWSEAEVVQFLDMMDIEAEQETQYYGA